MKTAKMLTMLVLVSCLVLVADQAAMAGPIGTAFTYQGRLIDANEAADGLYDFQFKLFDANTNGNKLGTDVNKAEVDVIDGYFTVELDFGQVFDGNERWLDIGVRPGELEDPNVYTLLNPRQQLTPTPYALYAKTAGSGGGESLWQVNETSIYYNNGNVGIGTDTPGDKLTVEGGTISVTNSEPTGRGVYGYANDGYVFSTNYGGYFVSSGGNGHAVYGLAESESSYIHCGGLFQAAGFGGRGVYGGNSESGYYGYIGGSDWAGYFFGDVKVEGTGNGVIFPDGTKQTTAGSSPWQVNGSNIYYNNGNVGIGTSDPKTRLHTIGAISSGWAGGINSPGTITLFPPDECAWFHIDNGPAGGRPTGRLRISVGNNPGDIELVSVLQTGNVGIGTTNPTAKLEVAGQVKITGGSPADGKVLTSDANGLAIWQTPAGAPDSDWTISGSNMYSGVSGNVGIGTTSPAQDLEVEGGVFIDHSGSSHGLDPGVALTVDGQASKDILRVRDVGANVKLLVNSNGNVGIGTSTPARNLHINGVMRLQPQATAPSSPVEGDIYMNSSTHKLMVYDGTAWQACW